MANKRNNNTLFIIAFLALTAGFAFITWSDNNKEDRTFKKEIVSIDTTALTKLVITNPEHGISEFMKDGANWFVTIDGARVPARNDVMNNMMIELAKLKPKQVAGLNEQSWENYKVDPAKSTQVEVYQGNTKSLHIHIGRFSFKQQPNGQMPGNMGGLGQQQQPEFKSYVRIDQDKETYAVDGMLEFTFKQNVKNLVDSTGFNTETLDPSIVE